MCAVIGGLLKKAAHHEPLCACPRDKEGSLRICAEIATSAIDDPALALRQDGMNLGLCSVAATANLVSASAATDDKNGAIGEKACR
jgi:hypothetical protein